MEPTTKMPDYLAAVAPAVGSLWEWEPLRSNARCLLRVTEVKWNGEECWVESDPMVRNVYFNPAPHQDRIWNTLSRWVQATVMVDVDDDHIQPITGW